MNYHPCDRQSCQECVGGQCFGGGCRINPAKEYHEGSESEGGDNE